MVELKGQTIKASAYDTFDITFVIKGYALRESDVAIFSIKDDYEDNEAEPLISKEITGITGNYLRVYISAEEMKQCGYGLKFYDIVLVNNAVRYTLNYPSKLILERVVHENE